MHKRYWSALALVLVALPAIAQQTGSIVRQSDREERSRTRRCSHRRDRERAAPAPAVDHERERRIPLPFLPPASMC